MLIVTACLQGTLLCLGVFFEFLGPNRGHGHEGHDKDAVVARGEDGEEEVAHEDDQDLPSEETPLLRDQ